MTLPSFAGPIADLQVKHFAGAFPAMDVVLRQICVETLVKAIIQIILINRIDL